MKALLLITLTLMNFNAWTFEIIPHDALPEASELLLEKAREKSARLALTMHKTRIQEEKVKFHTGKFLENKFADYHGTYETMIVSTGGIRAFQIHCDLYVHIYKSHLVKVDPSVEMILERDQEFDAEGTPHEKMILARPQVTCELKN